MASERRRIFVEDVPTIVPRRQRTMNLPGNPVLIAGGGGITWINRQSRTLLLLNDDLEPEKEFALSDLPLPQAAAKHERVIVLPNLTVIVISLDRVVAVDQSGRQQWTLAYPTWPKGMVGGDAVVVDQDLAIAVPQRAAHPGQSVPSAELAIVGIGDGADKERVGLMDEITRPQGFHAVSRRGRGGGFLEGAYGQDGA